MWGLIQPPCICACLQSLRGMVSLERPFKKVHPLSRLFVVSRVLYTFLPLVGFIKIDHECHGMDEMVFCVKYGES